MRREPRGEVGEFFGRFDRMFDEWAKMMPFRAMSFPHWHDVDDLIRVEEFRDNGTLVIRADLPGIDPEKDVQLSMSDGMLHIHAERREEDKKEDKGYLRRELRYGSLSRTLPLRGRDRVRHHGQLQGRDARGPGPRAQAAGGQEDPDQQVLTREPDGALALNGRGRPAPPSASGASP